MLGEKIAHGLGFFKLRLIKVRMCRVFLRRRHAVEREQQLQYFDLKIGNTCFFRHAVHFLKDVRDPLRARNDLRHFVQRKAAQNRRRGNGKARHDVQQGTRGLLRVERDHESMVMAGGQVELLRA